jgi:hypothetical protein
LHYAPPPVPIGQWLYNFSARIGEGSFTSVKAGAANCPGRRRQWVTKRGTGGLSIRSEVTPPNSDWRRRE